MTEDFFVLEYPAENQAGFCTLDQLCGFEDEWAVGQGHSLSGNPPKKLTMSMYAEEPRNTVLPDYVQNMNSLLVVSPRLKSFLEGQELQDVEYYSVEIKDHKGKTSSNDYFIAHLINPVDCIDVEASEVDWTGLGRETQRVFSMEQMVLDFARIPKERKLFFPRYYNKVPIVCKELAGFLKKEGFSNIDIVPISEYEP